MRDAPPITSSGRFTFVFDLFLPLAPFPHPPTPPRSPPFKMFTTLITAALFVAALHTVCAEFAMQVPVLTQVGKIIVQRVERVLKYFLQCKNARITWNSTSAPYDLVIVPSTDPCEGDIM
jgi:hypothetical protein